MLEQEQENWYHPLYKGIDTGFPLPLSTVYFLQIVKVTIYVFFVPKDFGKNFFCRYWKFSGIEFIPNGLGCQTDINAQLFEGEHSFCILFWHVPSPKEVQGGNIIGGWPWTRPVS